MESVNHNLRQDDNDDDLSQRKDKLTNEEDQKKKAQMLTGEEKRVKADFIPEVYFIGQIVGGTEFPTDQDGIFVQADVIYGTESWTMLGKQNQHLQTHTAYADDEGFFVFAHPFDFHFICKSAQNW